jgi:rubrerythrin
MAPAGAARDERSPAPVPGNHDGGGVMSTQQSPMDNLTYDLIQTLASKLEAIEAYEKYQKDAQGEPECRQLFQELIQDDRKHVGKLQQELTRHLGR